MRDLRHFTSHELLTRAAIRFPELGRATVFRTVTVLVDAGLLNEGPKSASGSTSYELAAGDHHDHIVCLDCDAIFEFENAKVEREQENLASALDFAPQHHTHVIYARCKKLKSKK